MSYEKPKALIEVRGEVLIERQIKQLKNAGVQNVIVVTGYKAEQFEYLKDRCGVKIIHNSAYLTRNNNSSIYAVKEYLNNSYICSSDNYFLSNPFEKEVDESYYAAVFAAGQTNEWCISEEDGWIKDVKVGGEDSWIMLGHVFWSQSFSNTFLHILEIEYNKPETANKLWESIYIDHIKDLPMRIRKYPGDYIFEFDTLDELREFDMSYITDTRSEIIKNVTKKLICKEEDIKSIKAIKGSDNTAIGFDFMVGIRNYRYYYKTKELEEKR